MNKKQKSVDYNLDENEDLKTALKIKKICVIIFTIIIMSPHIFFCYKNTTQVKDIILKTSVNEISDSELITKIKYNEIDTSLVFITRNSDEYTNIAFHYVNEYFDNLKNGGEIFYYDDSFAYMSLINKRGIDSQIMQKEYEKIQEECHFKTPMTFYIVDKTEISNKKEFPIYKEQLEDMSKIEIKIYIKNQIANIYKYLDEIYNINLFEKLNQKLVNEILSMDLQKIDIEKIDKKMPPNPMSLS